MKKRIFYMIMPLLLVLCFTACGQIREPADTPEAQTAGSQAEDENAESSVTPEAQAGESAPDTGKQTDDALSAGEQADADSADVEPEENEAVEEPVPDFMPGYATFDDWRARHLGSVGLISDKTLLVSIYLNEPECRWDDEDIEYTRKMMEIGYGYLEEQMREYGVQTDLVFDSKKNADLFYALDIEEAIPDYVTTEKERELDVEVDKWLTNIPVEELMQKYEADSIGFLFFIGHEGCSYSSMHFIDDGEETWDECCMLYLQDMYSKTLEYETPAVYAHELLHLFGAEDLYKDAEVFSGETYAFAKKNYPNDIMINTFETINGKYTIYPDKVVQVISPITAYLVGAADDTVVRENCPELLKDEAGCFSGSTYDRPF